MRKILAFCGLLLPAAGLAHAQGISSILGEEILSRRVAIQQVKEYILNRVAKPPAATEPGAWASEAARIRAHLLKDVVFRGWPREWVEARPRFEDAGILPGQGYRIRKLRYEIVPGFWSTALLYEPEHFSGKAPGILNINGHGFQDGKAAAYKQKRCINFARHGIAALSLEWVGCGELYRKGNEHAFGAHLDLVGTHELGLFYLAMRKGLDYLDEHPNIDRARLGVTGLSGGGWQTIVLSALDERVRVAVPVAGFSSTATRVEVRRFGDLGDVEQSATDLLEGLDYPHLVALRAPRPTLLAYNAEDDCCFRAPMVKPLVFDAMRPFFRMYGAEDAFAWHENRDPGTHNYEYDNRMAAYRFFSRHFGVPIEEELPLEEEVRSRDELTVGLPADNLTTLELARKLSGALQRGPVSAGDQERKRLTQVIRYEPVRSQRVWSIANTKNTGVETLSYIFEMNNGLSATGVLLKTIPTREDAPATIVLNDDGKKAATQTVTERLNRGEQVLAADLAFTGECCWDASGARVNLVQVVHGTGARAIGLEAAQLLELARWMRARSGRKQIRLETSGIRTQSIGMIAAALEPGLFSVMNVRRGMRSFQYLLDAPVAFDTAPDLFCFDLYKYFDIDRLGNMALPTNVQNTEPADAPKASADLRPRPHGALRVALAQLSIEDGDLARNLELATEAARQAARQKADFLSLPEAADYGWLHQQARRDALPIPGKYTGHLCQLARRYRMWISAGCLEKDGDKVYNAAVIIDRQGRIVLKHRKIDTLPWLTKHLYDAGSPADIKTVDTEFGRIGLTICADNFDIRKPQRVAEQGGWLLIAPHGFAAEQSKLAGNSVEYQNHIRNVASKTGLWVVAADAAVARVKGGAWKDWLHSGCSLVARPDGTPAIVARFSQPDFIVYDIPAEK